MSGLFRQKRLMLTCAVHRLIVANKVVDLNAIHTVVSVVLEQLDSTVS